MVTVNTRGNYKTSMHLSVLAAVTVIGSNNVCTGQTVSSRTAAPSGEHCSHYFLEKQPFPNCSSKQPIVVSTMSTLFIINDFIIIIHD